MGRGRKGKESYYSSKISAISSSCKPEDGKFGMLDDDDNDASTTAPPVTDEDDVAVDEKEVRGICREDRRRRRVLFRFR